MALTTHDNREPLDGWRDPRTDPPRVAPPRCCGLFAETNTCTTCGNYVNLPALCTIDSRGYPMFYGTPA